MRRLLTFVSWFIAGLMASGAICGALNSLYASVESRQREIATLRALGFNGVPVMTSVLAESLLLALPGALLGALVAWLLFNGNFVNSGSLLFKLSVTPYLVALGVVLGLAIGLVGGSLPALRAARQPVAEALRAS
jgi:putative ABC transport system permease protein